MSEESLLPILHVLRNPHGKTKEEIRGAALSAADVIEDLIQQEQKRDGRSHHALMALVHAHRELPEMRDLERQLQEMRDELFASAMRNVDRLSSRISKIEEALDKGGWL